MSNVMTHSESQAWEALCHQKMPYSFDDILSSKDIDKETLQKDWKNLCEFPADTNPRKFCGNPIIYKFQLKNLLNCRRDTKGYKTLEEWFADPVLKDELWKLTVKMNRRKKATIPSPTDIYECHRKCKGAIVPFKASTAKYIYKLFGAKNVLDPTAGWGGRMLGAMSLGINYTGIDTNVNMKSAYKSIMNINDPWLIDDGDDEMYGRFGNEEVVKMKWKSCLDVDFSESNYDLVLTSPPYANMELYEKMDAWKDKDDFYKTFMCPLMEKLFNETNCPICINISPKMYKDLTTKYGLRACDRAIDLRQQLGQQFKTKSQDYIYVWMK